MHFIGPHKPWHEPGPSRQQPGTSESHGESDYASLVNRWFSVYQRYFSVGDNKATFSFPTLQVIWDTPGRSPAYTPPSLEDLKRKFLDTSANITWPQQKRQDFLSSSLTLEGHYVSMPLVAGRPDLMGNLVFVPPSESPMSQNEDSPAVRLAAPPSLSVQFPSPQASSPEHWSPPQTPWDPAISEPPKHDRPQMESGYVQQYDNAWDEPRSASSQSFFTAPAYGAIPKVTYQDYDTVTHQHSPDISKVKAIFPWENQSTQSSSRIFPHERQQIPRPAPAPMPQPSQTSSRPYISASRDMSSLTSQYSNAWDNVPAIRKYADSMQVRPPQHRHNGTAGSQSLRNVSASLRGARAGGPQLQSGSVESRTAANGNGTRKGNGYDTGGEASSRDGDDEDDEDEDDEDCGNGVRGQESSKHKSSASGVRFSVPRSGALSPPYGSSGSTHDTKRSNSPTAQSGTSAVYRPELAKRTSSFQHTMGIKSESGQTSIPFDDSGRYRAARLAASRTSSSETISPASNGIRKSSLPNPSDGAYTSKGVERVFDSRTDTDHIKKEGLDALHRFVRSMETVGAAINGASAGKVAPLDGSTRQPLSRNTSERRSE